MARPASSNASLPTGAIVAIIIVVLAIIGYFGWKTIGGSGSGSDERVKVDVNKIKQELKEGGFGRR